MATTDSYSNSIVLEIYGQLFDLSKDYLQQDISERNSVEDNNLRMLNRERHEIEKRIQELLRASLNYPNIGKIKASINFEKGSIIASGWVIIETLGTIADFIGFIEMVRRIAGPIIGQVIQLYLPNNYSNNIATSLSATSINALSNKTSVNPKMIKYATLTVIILTIVNIFLFIGTLVPLIGSTLTQGDNYTTNFKILENKYRLDSARILLDLSSTKYLLLKNHQLQSDTVVPFPKSCR